jgi:hypothetical protein
VYEWKRHKPWFDDECSEFLDERKQWLQDPNQSNLDNMNNAGHEASSHFRNSKTSNVRITYHRGAFANRCCRGRAISITYLSVCACMRVRACVPVGTWARGRVNAHTFM